jgi:hypothetical protein
MLGRKNFTADEIESAKAEVAQQLAAYQDLAQAVAATTDPKAAAALEAFEARLTAGLVLALDRRFVHRVRMVAGKEGTPLNELEMLTDALMNNGGILRSSTVIRLIPEQSVLKLRIGDPIRLTADDFHRLAEAVLAELERTFL